MSSLAPPLSQLRARSLPPSPSHARPTRRRRATFDLHSSSPESFGSGEKTLLRVRLEKAGERRCAFGVQGEGWMELGNEEEEERGRPPPPLQRLTIPPNPSNSASKSPSEENLISLTSPLERVSNRSELDAGESEWESVDEVGEADLITPAAEKHPSDSRHPIVPEAAFKLSSAPTSPVPTEEPLATDEDDSPFSSQPNSYKDKVVIKEIELAPESPRPCSWSSACTTSYSYSGSESDSNPVPHNSYSSFQRNDASPNLRTTSAPLSGLSKILSSLPSTPAATPPATLPPQTQSYFALPVRATPPRPIYDSYPPIQLTPLELALVAEQKELEQRQHFGYAEKRGIKESIMVREREFFGGEKERKKSAGSVEGEKMIRPGLSRSSTSGATTLRKVSEETINPRKLSACTEEGMRRYNPLTMATITTPKKKKKDKVPVLVGPTTTTWRDFPPPLTLSPTASHIALPTLPRQSPRRSSNTFSSSSGSPPKLPISDEKLSLNFVRSPKAVSTRGGGGTYFKGMGSVERSASKESSSSPRKVSESVLRGPEKAEDEDEIERIGSLNILFIPRTRPKARSSSMNSITSSNSNANSTSSSAIFSSPASQRLSPPSNQTTPASNPEPTNVSHLATENNKDVDWKALREQQEERKKAMLNSGAVDDADELVEVSHSDSKSSEGAKKDKRFYWW